jgi:translocation and assembly module TamB
VLSLGVLVFVRSDWFQRWLEAQVIANLENLTGGQVKIAHFRFHPSLLQITMQQVVIRGLEPCGDPPLFSMRDVEIGLSPGQLLHRRLRLRHLDINAFQVHLRTDAHGVTNVPGQRRRTSAQQSLTNLTNLSIGRLTISHSVFFWNDQRLPVEIDAREMAILLRMTQGHYEGTLSSSAATIRTARWSPPSMTFNSRFEVSPAGLVFSPFAWQTHGMTGEASFTIFPHPEPQASGSYRATMEIITLAQILHAPELRSGTLRVEGLAVYQHGSLLAHGRAQAHQTVIVPSGLPPVRLDATARYSLEKQQFNLNDLFLSVWGGAAEGTLQADFGRSPARYLWRTRLHGVQLSNLLHSATILSLVEAQMHPASLADGNLVAAWSGQGEGLKADFDLALQAPEAVAGNVLRVSGKARGTLEHRLGFTLHLDDSELRTPHSKIVARGTLTQNGDSLATEEPLVLTLATDDFDEWRPFFQALIVSPSRIPLELASTAEFFGQLRGSCKRPFLQGRLSTGRIRYHGWTWDQLTMAVSINPEFLRISNGRVTRANSSFELDASAQLDQWRLRPNSALQFSAEARLTPVEGLIAAVNSDIRLRGSVTGRVNVAGTTTSLSGSGLLRVDAGAFADEPFDSLSAQVRVTESVWRFQNLQLKKGQGRLGGDVILEPEHRFASGTLTGTGFRLGDFHRLQMIGSADPRQGRMDGDLSFEAQGHGTPDDFHLDSSEQLRNLKLAGTPLGEFQGKLTGEGKQLKLEGDDQGPGGNLHLSLRAATLGDWPMNAEGRFVSVRADPLIRAFFKREFGAAVTLSGFFRASGPFRTPAKIAIDSQVESAAVDFPTVQWRNVQPVDAHYADGRLALSRFVMRGPFTELAIDGAIGFAHDVNLALSAEGTANAALLTVFDPSLQATGRSSLHLTLTGTPERPLLKGALDIQGASLGYRDLPMRFNGLQGRISLEGERAVISSLRGTSGGGKVDLSGFVTLAESPRYEVRADLSQVRVRYPPSFTSVLDGKLRLVGGIEQAELQGELVVHQMLLNENINFITKIIESSNPLPDQLVSAASPIGSKIRLNVRVTSLPGVQLQTPNLRLVGDIDLRLQGTVDNPVQVGSIHFLSGESVFRGNRYTLTRGDMNMTNPFRTQASLDMEVQTQVQNYDLTLDITGPFDRLKFSYRSDPPLSNTDILSLLALGYVKQEGAFSTTAGSPTATVGASAILSEALSTQTTSRIQHLFGVSRIKIDPNVGIPGYGAGALVTVEQQVTHDLTLTYVTDTSYSQYRIIQFEWNISDKVSVLGIRDQNGVFGVEFRFRRRFK